MNARNSITHQQANELLPWLLTGSMDDNERQSVSEHARSCVICRRELQELELINELIADAGTSAVIPPPDMRNINARIDRLVERRGWMRERLSRLTARIHNPWRLAFALQSALVIVLAVMFFWPGSDAPQTNDPQYMTLTQPQNLPAGHYVRVVFKPDMPVSEVANLLEEMKLTVANGPTARGIYTLGLTQQMTRESRDKLLASLQQDPNVLFAQWVARNGSPAE